MNTLKEQECLKDSLKTLESDNKALQSLVDANDAAAKKLRGDHLAELAQQALHTRRTSPDSS